MFMLPYVVCVKNTMFGNGDEWYASAAFLTRADAEEWADGFEDYSEPTIWEYDGD